MTDSTKASPSPTTRSLTQADAAQKPAIRFDSPPRVVSYPPSSPQQDSISNVRVKVDVEAMKKAVHD